MKQLTTITVVASLILSPVVMAETEVETETAGTETTTTFQDFNDLSPGNKMIARSLFDAQLLPADGSGEIWTLNDITAARAETGWGNVFKQLQAEGLVDAKNLGEIVSANARAGHQSGTETVAIEANESTEVTAEENNTDDTVIAETPADVDGAFENLSNGNQKIARSLFDAQLLPADGSVEPLTLDQIAAAKGETGWGNVFKQLQTEGLVDAKNLGQVVSQYKHNTFAVSDDTAGVTTTAVTSSNKRLPQQANGKATGYVNNSATGITNAAGSGNGNGNAYGLTKHSVSASEGITTAGGNTVAASGNGNAAISGNNVTNSAAGASITSAGGNNSGKGNAYGRNK